LNSVNVVLGQSVGEGVQIGSLGNSGCSTAAHLHFEIWVNGVAVDPAPYLKNASTQPSAGSSNVLKWLFIAGAVYYILYE
jgi:murein DD-endopeptidase MepM/ murein hydrolase activator NlpD